MSDEFIETYFEKVILPQYRDESIRVQKWIDHGKVGLDSYAHYFKNSAGVEFVLLNEDFPGGEYLNDYLTHDIIPVPGDSDEVSLHVKIGEGWIPNISGYFTLYKERQK